MQSIFPGKGPYYLQPVSYDKKNYGASEVRISIIIPIRYE